nr:TPA_asm: movement protein [Adonis ophiovirus]
MHSLSRALRTSDLNRIEEMSSLNRYDGTISRPKRIEAKSIGQSFVKSGEVSVISLKEGESELPGGIEEILMDFSKIHTGVIDTGIVPLTLQLKENEHRKSIKLATMKRIVSAFKKIGGIEDSPFITFDKIQFMYLPLFDKDEEDNGTLTISLIDDGKEKAGKDEVIQQVKFDASEMAMIELSMNFFVKKTDMEKISIFIEAEGVPIVGRAYAALNVAFFTHSASIPMKTDVRASTVLYIDPAKRPKDLNSSSVFKKIGEEMQERVKEKRNKFSEKERTLRRESARRNKNLLIEYESKQTVSSESEEEREKIMAPAMYRVWRKDDKPETAVRTTIKNGNGMMTMLDTGSPDHYFYFSGAKPNREVKNAAGVEVLRVEQAAVRLEVLGNSHILPEAFLFNTEDIKFNIMSYKKLEDAKVVDSMESAGSALFLYKDREIVMMFDIKQPGRMWLKDDVWNEATKGGKNEVW